MDVRGLPAISPPIVMTRLTSLSVNKFRSEVYTDEVMLLAMTGGVNKYGRRANNYDKGDGKYRG